MKSRAEIERAIQLLADARNGAEALGDEKAASIITREMAILDWVLDRNQDAPRSFGGLLRGFEAMLRSDLN